MAEVPPSARPGTTETYAVQREFFLESPVGVIVTAARDDGEVRLINAAAGSIFGMLPDVLIGQPIRVLPTSSTVEEILVQALVTSKTVTGEILLGDTGLPQHHINATVTPALYLGEPSLVWWLNDVTDIKRTEIEWRKRERQLQAVIDAAQDAVFEFLLGSGSANVSPRFWQMLGYGPVEAADRQETSTEAIYHVISEAHQLDFASSLRIPPQDSPYEWKGPAMGADGQEVWLHFRGRITDVLTEPRIIGVVTDITAQKAVEKSLREAKESAEESNRAKSAFLATMSHEIRTPMTAILGSLEYLLDTPLIKDQHRMVSIARDSGVSLLAILNDILDLSKIEAGKLTLEMLPTSPRGLIQGACDVAQIMARQKGISLRCRFASALPGLIITDAVRVRQILMNLVNNAVKFTDQGGVNLTAEIEDNKDGSGVLRVVVQDSGIGLTPEQVSRLFKPFSQADSTTTRKFGGTGLGLSICQRLVERMGGQIGVYSKPGQGATFWFWVTIQTTEEQPNAVQAIDLKGMPILLVDPDSETATKTAEDLTEAKAKVTVVSDGREALLKASRNAYGLVLIEQNLPEIKGLALVPALRTLSPEMNIVLYTGEDQETIGWAAQEAGVFYLPRSTPYQQFLETVRSFADGSAMGSEKKSGKLAGRVLIAEDTASVRQILEVQVKGLGVDVDFVENGRQALDKLQRGHYALVISDLHMPEVDGYGLVREWRAREEKRAQGEHLPIVALTADVLIGDASKFIAEGFDDYMAKPVSRDALRGLITKWLNLVRDNDEKAIANQNQAAGTGQVESVEGPPPVDHARLIEILGLDDADILAEAMEVFVHTAKETFAALEKAYAAEDAAAAKGPAHSLKGSARMAGAVVLGDIAAEIDAAAKKGELVPERLTACTEELSKVISYVEKVYLKG